MYPNVVEKLFDGERLVGGGERAEDGALHVAKPGQHSLLDELRRSVHQQFPVGDRVAGRPDELAGRRRHPADRVDPGLQRPSETVVDRTHERSQQPRRLLRRIADPSHQRLQHAGTSKSPLTSPQKYPFPWEVQRPNHWTTESLCEWLGSLVIPSDCSRVKRRSRRTFSTDFEIFRRRFDGVVIYFFFSIPTSNFSTKRQNFQSLLYTLFLFSLQS